MATALELGEKGWKPFIGNKKLSPQITDLQIIERDKLMVLVSQAANNLKAKYNIRKIILFGSLAHKSWFNEDSDVDLAVEGLSSIEYWEAWREIEDIITDRNIDFVDMSDISEPIKNIIKSEGIEL